MVTAVVVFTSLNIFGHTEYKYLVHFENMIQFICCTKPAG